ncbi:hypothetical protein ACP4OV_006036 [Aristida adscensionis]
MWALPAQMQGSQSRNGSNAAAARKARPWYRRALGALLRRQPAVVDAPAAAAPARARPPAGGRRWNLRSSFACMACFGVHVDAAPPPTATARRTRTAGPGRPLPTPEPPRSPPAMLVAEWAGPRPYYFRGSSLQKDVLMRRFVMAEEAERQRMQMQEAAKRSGRVWFPPGPSRLSHSSSADDVAEDEEGLQNVWWPWTIVVVE